MALSRKFLGSFELDVRVRGDALYEKGVVQFYEWGHERVRAEIMDDEYADVRLEVEGKTLEVECDCGDGDGCHHVWAVLRAAEASGELLTAGKRSVGKEIRIVGGDVSEIEELEYCAEPSAGLKRGGGVSGDFGRMSDGTEVFSRPVVAQPVVTPSRYVRDETEADIELNYVVSLPGDRVEEVTRVGVYWRSRGRDGGWGARRPYEFKPFEPSPGEEDDAILSLVGPVYNRKDGVFELPSELAVRSLPLMAVSGRLYWRRGDGDEMLTPLAWDGEQPWVLRLEVDPDGEGRYHVTGALVRDGETLGLDELDYVCEGGLCGAWTQLGVLDHGEAFDWLCQLRQSGSFVVPAWEVPAFMRRIYVNTRLSTDHFPTELQYEIGQPSVTGRLYVRTAKYLYRGSEQLHADLSFDYDGLVVEEKDPAERLVHDGKRQLIERSMGEEEACRNLLQTLEFRHVARSTSEETGWKLHPGKLDQAVRRLVEQDWLVVAQGKTYRKPTEKKASLSGKGRDWFDLQGSVQFGDEVVSLPVLLALQKKGEAYVRLDDGTLGVLPTEWLEKYTVLTEIAQDNGETLSFRRSQAALLEALCSELELGGDEVFEQIRQQARAFEGFSPVEAPGTFQGTLRDYQRLGLGWMMMLQDLGIGGCLADDMGLGKTVQVLALLEYRRLANTGKPSLVVLPKSLIFNWQAEAARFAPQLRVMVHTGAGRRTHAAAFRDVDVVLTTYGTLRVDAPELRKVSLDYCILDESQAIKNADTSTAKAVRLLQADHRLAMSGTPIENHIGELFSQFEFLNPGMLGRRGVDGAGGKDGLSDEQLEKIAKGIRPFVLRRRKEEVATDLPEKSDVVLYCDLEPEQRKHYDDLKEYYRDNLLRQKAKEKGDAKAAAGSGRAIEILEALLRLRQCACHPGLINEKYLGSGSVKLDMITEKLVELKEEGHKALVFSQFTSFLGMIRSQLEQFGVGYTYLDGQTKDRQEQVERFQEDSDLSVFLISLKAGGVGLNLTAADYVFLLDPWWNPAVEAQAVDRAYRIGQTRKVFAYRMIARDTVEEKVLAMQNDKRELAEAVISSNAGFISQLTADDLAFLLG